MSELPTSTDPVRLAAEALRVQLDAWGDECEWGTLPWLVDRALDACGAGAGSAPSDVLEMTPSELAAVGALLALIDEPGAAELATEVLYGER